MSPRGSAEIPLYLWLAPQRVRERLTIKKKSLPDRETETIAVQSDSAIKKEPGYLC